MKPNPFWEYSKVNDEKHSFHSAIQLMNQNKIQGPTSTVHSLRMPYSVDKEHLIYLLHARGNVQKTFHVQQSHKPPLIHACFLALLRLKNGEKEREKNGEQCLRSTKAPARAQPNSPQNLREATDRTDLNAFKDRFLDTQ